MKCRTCNASSDSLKFYYLFQEWTNPWNGMQSTIAKDLINLTGISIEEGDMCSSSICEYCCIKLQEACVFVKLVQENDNNWRNTQNAEPSEWPKPILVENTVIPNVTDMEIKQEVLSDTENQNDSWMYNEMDIPDIKVEPEEIEYKSNDLLNLNSNILTNGEHCDDEVKNVKIKEELSEDECDSEMSLECILCKKMLSSLSGLKAHVIAQHSYNLKKSKHECLICKLKFETSTDLMVHETCHSETKCYSCNRQFDTFANLSKHSRRCKANKNGKTSPPKVLTLEDVIRTPAPKEESKNTIISENEDSQFKCHICDSTFTEQYYLTVHQEIHYLD